VLTFINNELDGTPDQRESLTRSTSASLWVLFDQQERTRQNYNLSLNQIIFCLFHNDAKDASPPEVLILQAWWLEKWDWDEALDINWGANNVIYKVVHNCCPFPPVEPGASTNFQRRHTACGIEYHL
jgi:hypothetical protein